MSKTITQQDRDKITIRAAVREQLSQLLALPHAEAKDIWNIPKTIEIEGAKTPDLQKCLNEAVKDFCQYAMPARHKRETKCNRVYVTLDMVTVEFRLLQKSHVIPTGSGNPRTKAGYKNRQVHLYVSPIVMAQKLGESFNPDQYTDDSDPALIALTKRFIEFLKQDYSHV